MRDRDEIEQAVKRLKAGEVEDKNPLHIAAAIRGLEAALKMRSYTVH